MDRANFDITTAPKAQQHAIDACTELVCGMLSKSATSWFAGPFGQAYTDAKNSADEDVYLVIWPDGRVEMHENL